MKNKFYPLTVLALLFVLVLIFSFKNKTASSNGILSLRTSETTIGLGDNSITIVYEDGQVEKAELKKLNTRDMSLNLVTVTEYLNKIKSKGYKLISSTGGTTDNGIMMTYTFEK